MDKKAVENFLKEKKKYNQNDVNEFWKDYLAIDPKFEYTEEELDVLVEEKGVKIDWEGINESFKEIDRVYPDKNKKKSLEELDGLEKEYPGYKNWYYEKLQETEEVC